MTIRILDPVFKPHYFFWLWHRPSARHARPKGMVPTQEGAPFLAGRKTTATTEKRTQTCQKQRNSRRSLALPVSTDILPRCG